ncbi:hypothetical protein M997_3330 [Proteus hauseri ATCC 700826]|uniref:Uncharacterized protein n=1 Tax=Proteus hauseri ATCC 700826 TaxID=1354271 RepID=A0AAJ3HPU6_PROHU|nr:hypothetical protein [Proteus hauseri]OAT44964.1 hypothetical protein M997_3330 [Proteus hauseri ATCC 700826]
MIHIISNGNKISLNSMSELNSNGILKSVLKLDHVMYDSFDSSKLSPENIIKLKKKLNLMEGLSKKESILTKKNSFEEVNENKDVEEEKYDEKQLENTEGLLLNQQDFFYYTYNDLKRLHIKQGVNSIQNKNHHVHTCIIKTNVSEQGPQLNSQEKKEVSKLKTKVDISKTIKIEDKKSTLISKKVEGNLYSKILGVKNKNSPSFFKEKSEFENADNTQFKAPFVAEPQSQIFEESQSQKNTIDLHLIKDKYDDYSDVKSKYTEVEQNIFSNKINKNSSNIKNIKKNGISSLHEGINSDVKIEAKRKKEKIADPESIIFSSVTNPKTSPSIALSETTDKILDISSWKILHKHVLSITQPPSITYVFKQWGSDIHQMKINFIDRQVQLIASTGRVYQSSIDNSNQYQGRLSLALNSENKSMHWHINAIDSSVDKESDKE